MMVIIVLPRDMNNTTMPIMNNRNESAIPHTHPFRHLLLHRPASPWVSGRPRENVQRSMIDLIFQLYRFRILLSPQLQSGGWK